MGNHTGPAVEGFFYVVIDNIFSFVSGNLPYMPDTMNQLDSPTPYLVCFFLGIVFTVLCTTFYHWLKKVKQQDRDICGTGKIHYNRRRWLGGGSYGTNVYEGKYENIDVAVKVIKLRSSRHAERIQDRNQVDQLYIKRLRRELDINQDISLKNDFIVQYYGQEIFQLNQSSHVLVALEFCKENLQGVVDHWSDFEWRVNLRKILDDLSQALFFLHRSEIVHRDLKAANILLQIYQHPVSYRFKIADFGVSKSANFVMDEGQFSISGTYGSPGWTAPEVQRQLNSNTEGTSAQDVFSMGLIFYFAATQGKMLYESQDDIQRNVYIADPDIIQQPVWDLIQKMTLIEEHQRISAREIKSHVALWEPKKILIFFSSVSEVLRNTNVPGIDLNHGCFLGNWNEKLTSAVRRSIERTVYNYTSVKDLIRAIRNTDTHYLNSTRSVKREFGANPDYFVKYWTKKFPKLLLHTYRVIENHREAKTQLSKFYYM